MKTRFHRKVAIGAARELVKALKPACQELIVAGSLRRGRTEVGDVEIIYIPIVKTLQVPGDLFARKPTPLTDPILEDLMAGGVIERRENKNGGIAWGPKNKLARHCKTGVPIDLFTTNEESWFNYLVCRTGPASFNTRVASRARELGVRWEPYGTGFRRDDGSVVPVRSERELFNRLKLDYLEPCDRQ